MRWLPLLVLVGCFDPKFNNPACGPEGECPAGLTCIAGTCRMPIDADTPLDAPDATIDARATKVFRQGLDGYNAARDAWIDTGSPNAQHGNDNAVRWRTGDRFGLLAFDGVFASGGIPTTAMIVSATLTFEMTNSPNAGTIYEVAVPWDETVTANTFGPAPGVQATDIGLAIGTTPIVDGPYDVDVAASLERWAANPSSNQGWLFEAPQNGSVGESTFLSSDHVTEATRPQLTVVYFP